MNRHIVTTADKYDDGAEKLILNIKEAEGLVKDIQKVIAVGPHVRDINVGDYVCINPKAYIKVKHNLSDDLNGKSEMEVKVNFPVVDMEDGRFLLLWEDDVDYIIEEFGEEIKLEKKLIYEPPIIL